MLFGFKGNKSKEEIYSKDEVYSKEEINELLKDIEKPYIPTKVSELLNDSGFVTSASIPTKVSALENDSKFVTETDFTPVKNGVDKKAVYTDFVITRSTHQHSGGDFVVSTSARNADLYATVTKSGYYPIALLGVRGTDAREEYDFRYGYLTNQAEGSCIANWIFTNNTGQSINASSVPSCEVTILWAKIRK